MEATALLRPGLLDGRTVALGGGGPFAPALSALGATPATLPATREDEEAAEHARAALAAHGEIAALVHDLRPAFGVGGDDGLQATLAGAWATVRAVANAAWIDPGRPGLAVLVAPPPGGAAAPAADGVRGAAENLARTLSIEWSRFGVRTVALTPGARTPDSELAALVAYLVSPAGDYFSGALLSPGALAESPSPG